MEWYRTCPYFLFFIYYVHLTHLLVHPETEEDEYVDDNNGNESGINEEGELKTSDGGNDGDEKGT
jgi:hypothetical protein